MSNYLMNDNNEIKIEKLKKMHAYYPEFIVKNIFDDNNFTNHESNKENNLYKKKSFNKRYIQNINVSNFEEPYNKINFKYENKNNNLYNSIIPNDYNEKKFNKNRNKNLKKYYSLSMNDDYDEYIIDYKNGLNFKNLKRRKKFSVSDDTMAQNSKSQRLINSSNLTYNKIFINNYTKNSINNDITPYNNKFNKNKTWNNFNSKGKINKNCGGAPYKKRIVNDYGYGYNDYKEKIKNININLKYTNKIEELLSQNNIFDNNNKMKVKYNTINYGNNTIVNDKVKIYKKASVNLTSKRPSFNRSKIKTKNELLIKIEKFIQHFSIYCMLYYFQILKKFFSSLNQFDKLIKSKNEKNSPIINNKKIPITPLDKNTL